MDDRADARSTTSMASLRSLHASRVVELQRQHNLRMNMHGRQSPAGLGDSMRSETSSRSRAFKVFAHVGACEATSTAGKAAVLTTTKPNGKKRKYKFYLDGAHDNTENLHRKAFDPLVAAALRGYDTGIIVLGFQEPALFSTSESQPHESHVGRIASALLAWCSTNGDKQTKNGEIQAENASQLDASVVLTAAIVSNRTVVDALVPSSERPQGSLGISYNQTGGATIVGLRAVSVSTPSAAVDIVNKANDEAAAASMLTDEANGDTHLLISFSLAKGSSTTVSTHQLISDLEILSGTVTLACMAVGSQASKSQSLRDALERAAVHLAKKTPTSAKSERGPDGEDSGSWSDENGDEISSPTATVVRESGTRTMVTTLLQLSLSPSTIPRFSKSVLTSVLRADLGGKGRTSLLLLISPETTGTANHDLLLLGVHCRNIVNYPEPTQTYLAKRSLMENILQDEEPESDAEDEQLAPSSATSRRSNEQGSAWEAHVVEIRAHVPRPDRFTAAVAQNREAVQVALREEEASENALAQARAALARAHGASAEIPNYTFSGEYNDGSIAGKVDSTDLVHKEKQGVEKDRARLQWNHDMLVAESFILMATDWAQLCLALEHPEVGVPRLDASAVVEAFPDAPFGVAVFAGEDLVWWIRSNLDGIETPEEATLICMLLLKMREIVPFNARHAQGAAIVHWKEDDWYCFGGNNSFRGGLRLPDAVADAVKEVRNSADFGADEFYSEIMPTVVDYTLEGESEIPSNLEDFPLLDAIVRRKKKREVKNLLEAFDPNMRDAHGRTALHYAVIVNNPAACRFLVKQGADVDAPDFHGACPLLYASMKMHVDVVTALLSAGANLRIADAYGQTAIHWATRHYDTAILKALLHNRQCDQVAVNQQDYTDYMTPIQWAIAWDGTPHVRLLLDAGADPLRMDRQGRSALDYCIHFNRPDCLTTVLAAYPRAVNSRNASGATPLLHASKAGTRACLEILLKSKHLDVNATDRTLSTPLHEAVKGRRKALTRRLIDRGAHCEAVNANGNTPLMCAIHNNDFDIQELFSNDNSRKPNSTSSGSAVQPPSAHSRNRPLHVLQEEPEEDIVSPDTKISTKNSPGQKSRVGCTLM